MNSNIFLKIRSNGLGWFYARLKRELRNPTFPVTIAVIDSVLRVKKKLSRLLNREKSHDMDILYAIYDLEVSAMTYNFAEFLIDAEYEANISKKNGFVVVFVPSSNDQMFVWKEFDSAVDFESRQWRFQNILIPLAFLSKKCKGLHILSSRTEVASFVRGRDVYPYLYDGVNLRSIDIKDFFQKLDRPYLFDGLSASAQGLRYIQAWMLENKVQAPIVTITLRTAKFDPARNSNIEAWSSVAAYLFSSGYHPVVIPDTDNAFCEMSEFEGITFFRECAWNLGLRMALYESAFLNFFVMNGCFGLAYLGTRCSYICMNCLPEGSIVTTEEAWKKVGHAIGTDFKFATNNQKLVFRPDSYENIITEFELFLKNSAGSGESKGD